MKPGIMSVIHSPSHIDALPARYHWYVYLLARKVEWLERLARTEDSALAKNNASTAAALAAVEAEYHARGRAWPFSTN